MLHYKFELAFHLISTGHWPDRYPHNEPGHEEVVTTASGVKLHARADITSGRRSGEQINTVLAGSAFDSGNKRNAG